MRVKKKNLIWVAVMAALLGWTVYTILKKQTPGQLAEAIASADWRYHIRLPETQKEGCA